MRKDTLLFAALLTASVTLTAQTVQMEARMGSESTVSTLPKELTKDGKAYMTVVDFDHNGNKSEIGIYESPGPQGIKLSIPVPLQESSDTYYQKAEGVIETVRFDNKFYDKFTDKDTTYTISMIPEIEAFVRKLWGYGDSFQLTEFTDADGMKALMGNNLRDDQFYQFERYGRKYPYEFWGVSEDSCVCMYHFFGYYTELDTTNAVWTKDIDYSVENGYCQYELNLKGFLYQDIDNSFYPTTTIFASQNIFNDDDNWEYLTADIELIPRFGDGWICDDWVIRRSVNQSRKYKGLKIMNSKGSQLAYISLPDEKDENTTYLRVNSVSVMNGLIYILTSEDVQQGSGDYYQWKTYEGVYVINPTTTQVMSISRAPSRMEVSPTVVEQGSRLDIHVSEPAGNDNVTVSGMSGQEIESSGIKDGTVSFDTSAMPKGIYNVTLRGKSGTPENQRIIIK
ncbi:MAG: T9SS type A sorting domain-containing protein [Bacteroidaceae bacterium]|nr:T9SS type A sorting domain-containing protein [Bacteroidaceae bacterium]